MSFVINLNPTNPTYLVKCEVRADGILSPLPATWVTETTQDINRAKRFANAWLADEVARDIRGWGGTQRVQQVDCDLPEHMTRPEMDFDSFE